MANRKGRVKRALSSGSITGAQMAAIEGQKSDKKGRRRRLGRHIFYG